MERSSVEVSSKLYTRPLAWIVLMLRTGFWW
jgi:hypothetical protein